MRHPRSKHEHLLDYVIPRACDQNNNNCKTSVAPICLEIEAQKRNKQNYLASHTRDSQMLLLEHGTADNLWWKAISNK